MNYLVLGLKGAVYGLSSLVPGVCSGIVLMMLGLYEPFVEAMGNFFLDRQKWKSYVSFLVVLGIGAVVGIIASASVVSWLLDRYPTPTMFLFVGLLTGTIPAMFRSRTDMRPTVGRVIALLGGLGVVMAITLLQRQAGQAGVAINFNSVGGAIYTLVTSTIAGGAGIAPGISGTYLFLLAGTYEPIVNAASALKELSINWAVLVPAGIGIVGGTALFSKLIDTALKRAPSMSYYCIVGLVLASVYGLWPQDRQGASMLAMVLPFCVGLVASMLIGRRSEPTGVTEEAEQGEA